MCKSLFLLTILSFLAAAAHAGDASTFDEGKRLASQGRRDFALMSFQSFLRENPVDKHAAEAHFAVAEYYSDVRSPGEVFKHLRDIGGRDDAMSILASVYRLKAAEVDSDKATASKIAEELKTGLASKKLFAFYKKKRDRTWRSPLDNTFEFRESADRMEILRNGSPFYEITLP